ncbi:MAG: DUF2341 domain-containing protein [Candidatus Nitrosoabyssus spongiisocia]|nr:MAG: DUF2341 domain-containing protein [Nitrosopumilaceae archaeon AB1(1)]
MTHSYSEQNATTDDNSPVTIGGDTVNSSLKGNYTVTYDSVDSAGNNATQVNRLVIVSDTIPPVITLIGNATVYVELDSSYSEQNATTDDGSPVTIGGDTVNSSLVGNYTITYNSADSSGNNATQVVRTVIIFNASDTTPPVITLNGNNVVYVEIYSSYSEQNATTDDGSPIVIRGDTVDTNTAGNYTITYHSADSSGNNATQVNRTVVVQQILGASWNTRLQITMDSSQVIGNHENFTALISINDTNLNSIHVQSAGQDIRFTTTDGTTLLEYEIVSFTNDAFGGTLVAWVRLPTLSNTSDTTLYMYYNVSTASPIAYPDVWDSDYEIIYHMDQSTFRAHSILDSSGNDCHATPESIGNTDFDFNDLVSCTNW